MSVEAFSQMDGRLDGGALFKALWLRLPRIAIVTAAAVVAAFAVLLFVPKQYESVASLLVEPRGSTYTQAAPLGTATTAAASNVTIDALMSSQIELVKSRDSLLSVVDIENLRSVAELAGGGAGLAALFGGKADATNVTEKVLQNLSDRLTVARERDSAVVSVRARAGDPGLAARIANAIAVEHVKRRSGLTLADTAEATVWLEQQIDELRAKVREADAKVADYRAQNDIFAGNNGTSLPDQQIAAIGAQITEAQGRRNKAEQSAASLGALLQSGESVEGAEDVRGSAAIQTLIQSRATFKGTLAERQATFLPAHPTIRGLEAQISAIDNQVRDEARRIAKGLAAQAGAEGRVIAALNDDLARARLSASAQAKDSVALDSFVREAKAQRDLLDSYLIKYRDAAGRTDVGSQPPDVRIISRAAAAVVPASPKVSLILIAVALVTFVLQAGAVMFGELMSGRIVLMRPPAVRGGVDQLMPREEFARHSAAIRGDVVATGRAGQGLRPEHQGAAPRQSARIAFDDHAATAGRSTHGEARPVRTPPAVDDRPPPRPSSQFAPPPQAAKPAPLHATIVEPAAPAAPVGLIIEDVAADAVEHRRPPAAATVPSPLAGADQTRAVPRPAPAKTPDVGAVIGKITRGEARIFLVSALDVGRDAAELVDHLTNEALQRGLSVCRIDAGSGRASTENGLSDLCAEQVGFGDVVHRVSEGLAHVPWGQLAVLDRRSARGVTLVEALADIYEVVVISTGGAGLASGLPVFSGVGGELILARRADVTAGAVERFAGDAAALGFARFEVVVMPAPQSAVA